VTSSPCCGSRADLSAAARELARLGMADGCKMDCKLCNVEPHRVYLGRIMQISRRQCRTVQTDPRRRISMLSINMFHVR